MADLSGRCLCGQVHWVSPGPILWGGFCHCDSCRRATSSPVTAFFGVPRETLVWAGQTAVAETSGGRVQRLYCPACGSQMSYQADHWPGEAHLYAATLDDPSAFVPKAHYHFAEKLPWLGVADDLPKYAASAEGQLPLA